MISLKNQLSLLFENSENLKKYIITTLEDKLDGNITSSSYNKNSGGMSISLSYDYGDIDVDFEIVYENNALDAYFTPNDKFYSLLGNNNISNILMEITKVVENNIKPRLEQEFG